MGAREKFFELRRELLDLIPPEEFEAISMGVFLKKKSRKEKYLDEDLSIRVEALDEIFREYNRTAPEEFRKLYAEYKKLKEVLFKENEGLIHQVMRNLRVNREHYQDFYQYASIGLLKAIESWCPSKGAFSTVAYNWIKAMVLNAMNSEAQNRFLSYDEEISGDSDNTYSYFISSDASVFCQSNDDPEQIVIARMEEEDSRLFPWEGIPDITIYQHISRRKSKKEEKIAYNNRHGKKGKGIKSVKEFEFEEGCGGVLRGNGGEAGCFSFLFSRESSSAGYEGRTANGKDRKCRAAAEVAGD